MAPNLDKLFGPKPAHDTPVNPQGAPAGLVPLNVHPSYGHWPFFPAGPAKSILPSIHKTGKPLGS